MERFLSAPRSRSQSLPRSSQHTQCSQGEKMAELTAAQDTGALLSPVEGMDTEGSCRRMAEVVARLLKPTITEAVQAALQQGLQALHTKMEAHSKSLQEAEARVSSLEDELLETQAKLSATEEITHTLQSKMDDLENRSRRNNLRIIGLPESIKPPALIKLCTETIPELLGVINKCVIERAHRLGAPKDDRPAPRPVIVRYLNYADKALLLQKFRNQRSLEVEGHNILLFADYSAEVAKKRRAFARICSDLYQQRLRFTLAYPATLHLTTSEGANYSFQDPQEAELFMSQLNQPSGSPLASPLPPRTPRKGGKTARRLQGTPRKNKARKGTWNK